MLHIRIILLVIILSVFSSTISFATKSEPPIYTENQLNISVTKDKPEFVIRLKATPSTGYNWFLREYDSKLILPLKYVYEPSKTNMAGAAGDTLWTFRVKPSSFIAPQITQIRFVYTRAWEASSQNQQLIFKVVTIY